MAQKLAQVVPRTLVTDEKIIGGGYVAKKSRYPVGITTRHEHSLPKNFGAYN